MCADSVTATTQRRQAAALTDVRLVHGKVSLPVDIITVSSSDHSVAR